MVNHFEYHKEISTKSGLIKNLNNWCEVFIFKKNNYYFLFKF